MGCIVAESQPQLQPETLQAVAATLLDVLEAHSTSADQPETARHSRLLCTVLRTMQSVLVQVIASAAAIFKHHCWHPLEMWLPEQ